MSIKFHAIRVQVMASFDIQCKIYSDLLRLSNVSLKFGMLVEYMVQLMCNVTLVGELKRHASELNLLVSELNAHAS